MNHRRTQPLSLRLAPSRGLSRGRGFRRGFNLIEILIVIGVILILVGIAVIGFNVIEKSTSRKATAAALATAKSLLVNYEQVQPLSELDEVLRPQGVTKRSRYPAPGDVNDSADANNNQRPDRHDPAIIAIGRTHDAVRALMRVPENKDAIEKMGKDSLLKRTPGTPTDNPPMLADGWGNPLILVPSGGLTDVVLESRKDPQGNAPPVVVTSAGVVDQRGTAEPIYPPGSLRPFWASPGPDGDFTTGDDNVYSFQN